MDHYLNPLFTPRSVAIFGASDRAESLGAMVLRNMLAAGYNGAVYAINPKYTTVQGQPCYPDLAAVAQPVALAIIATPAATVPGIIESCGKLGVHAAVVLSAGFGESGPEGAALERRLVDSAHRHHVRVIGPNCLGVMRPSIGLNATFNNGNAKDGNLAFVSQSGALCTAILDWAGSNDIGFSSVVSMGSSADVDFGEVLDFLVSDARTEAILLYIEGIRNARTFMSALRAAARMKPVIAIKVGRHTAGSKAAQSHTGALVGSDEVFDEALRRAGVVRVQTIGQLFSSARALASRLSVAGNRLAIVTNGGGPGVMATDRAMDLNIALAELGPQTIARLNLSLPAIWSHGNPVDVIGDATPERYQAAVSACMEDPGVDGVLVILTPQAMTRPLEVAQALIALAPQYKKPLVTCWMGEQQIVTSRDAFVQARVPSFRTPEAAVEAFSYIAAHHQNQQLLMQVPGPLSQHQEPDASGARMIIESALAERRKVLTEAESKAILAAFRIPIAPAMIARSPAEALQVAEEMGFPVAMKIHSPDITHKSDVGGVRLNLSNAEALRAAFHDMLDEVARHQPQARLEGVLIEPMVRRANGRELMVGVSTDPIFGPIISFGIGGTAVEALRDRAVALPPLNEFLISRLIARTRIATMLGQFRNLPPIDFDALENVLLRVSEMVCELPWLKEMDINPLIADENGIIAADARIVVDHRQVSSEPYAHMAIYPYPSHLVSRWQLPDGREVVIRPIRPEDAEIEQAFVRGLSAESKYFRFMDTLEELNLTMLVRFTQIDYDREMALVAVTNIDGRETELAVTRYAINPDGSSCEFAIAVADAWQGKGIGHKIMEKLMDAARARGLKIMIGDVLASNANMVSLVTSLGFVIESLPDEPTIRRATKLL